MICSNNVKLIEPLKPYRWVGIDKDTWKRVQLSEKNAINDAMHWHYDISVLGYKYNMNDVMAAIGLVQLEKLDDMNDRRRRIISRYINGIKDIPEISLYLPYTNNGDEAYWFFAIRVEDRDNLLIHLKSKGIATGVHFYPLTLRPLYKNTILIVILQIPFGKNF